MKKATIIFVYLFVLIMPLIKVYAQSLKAKTYYVELLNCRQGVQEYLQKNLLEKTFSIDSATSTFKEVNLIHLKTDSPSIYNILKTYKTISKLKSNSDDTIKIIFEDKYNKGKNSWPWSYSIKFYKKEQDKWKELDKENLSMNLMINNGRRKNNPTNKEVGELIIYQIIMGTFWYLDKSIKISY